MVAFAEPVAVALPIVGAPGTPFVVIDCETADATESPTTFEAITVKV